MDNGGAPGPETRYANDGGGMSDDGNGSGAGDSDGGTDAASDVPDWDDLSDVDGETEDVSTGETPADEPTTIQESHDSATRESHEAAHSDESGRSDSDETTSPIGDASPFDELAGSVESDDLDDVFEEAFDDVSTDVETDDLWEELEDGEIGGAEGSEEPAEVVSKRAFCEQCEHLSEPPEFRCTHEGTEILDFVDSDHVRVRDCPVVAKRRGVESE